MLESSLFNEDVLAGNYGAAELAAISKQSVTPRRPIRALAATTAARVPAAAPSNRGDSPMTLVVSAQRWKPVLRPTVAIQQTTLAAGLGAQGPADALSIP